MVDIIQVEKILCVTVRVTAEHRFHHLELMEEGDEEEKDEEKRGMEDEE